MKNNTFKKGDVVLLTRPGVDKDFEIFTRFKKGHLYVVHTANESKDWIQLVTMHHPPFVSYPFKNAAFTLIDRHD